MPLYPYRCMECGRAEDHVRPYEERDEAPDCRCGERMKRTQHQISRPKFKGPGFYATEYFNKNRPWDSISDVPPENVDEYHRPRDE